MNKTIFALGLCFIATSAFSQIRDFQTTRLNSTAGTGVASILSTEAAVLNPAASTFFEGSSASFQSYKTSLRDKNSLRDSTNDSFAKRNQSQGHFVSDHSGPVKGGVAYLQQNENQYSRERMVLHGAAPMGPNASFGVAYNFIQEKLPRTASPRHRNHHQVTFGTSYIIDEDTILGLVVIDPTRTTPGEERTFAGFQYQIAQRLSLMGDVGAQHTKSFDKNYIWRAAIQVNIFSDFFLRAGKFYDNVTKFKGTGWGVSWLGPRLGIEFAQKMSDQFGRNGYIYEEEQLVDTSISVLLKF